MGFWKRIIKALEASPLTSLHERRKAAEKDFVDNAMQITEKAWKDGYKAGFDKGLVKGAQHGSRAFAALTKRS